MMAVLPATEYTDADAAGASSHRVTDWHAIDWQKAEHNVRRLQARIVKATEEKRWGKVKALQRLLTHSFSGKALAVRRVTENQGKNTPGVDKVLWNTPQKKLNAVYSLRQRDYHPQPLRRVYIPKKNGKKRPLGIPIKNLYRQLYNPQFYLQAYARLYSNDGAMTPDTTGETVDGMSREKINTMIDLIRHERWRWTPVKRVYIPKRNGKLRPLGLPSWSSKVMQEVVRQLLDAYFEPTFSDQSHGFRSGRGCHTALSEIAHGRKEVHWFIE